MNGNALALLDSGGKGLTVGVASRALARLPHLAVFLGLEQARFVVAGRRSGCDLYLGWGNKASGLTARRLAERARVPFLLLEDGFLRSLAPHSVAGEPPLGLVIDDRGIYYDAAQPSRLESLIAEPAEPIALAQAERLRADLRRLRLSKYNAIDPAADARAAAALGEGFVLAVDQTFGDASIAGARATAEDFRRMLEAAREENPGRAVVVKLHPEVAAGRKRGYLAELAKAAGLVTLADAVNPWTLLERAGKVYTVSSQLGFEALLAGVPVRCFGLPFYAGWGLTADEMACERRRAVQDVTLERLLAASHIAYSRYVEPFGPARIGAARALELLGEWRDAQAENQALGPFLHITPWKRPALRRMFARAGGGRMFFATRTGAIRAAKRTGRPLVAWASKVDDRLERSCARAGVALCRLEDGFIRSVGLGADFHPPMSLILDHTGIYYDATRPSGLERLIEAATFPPALLERAGALIETLRARKISKYNLRGDDVAAELPARRPRILVPGQVESDASIRLGATDGLDAQGLLRRLRETRPDAALVYKPHPDVLAGQRPGFADRAAALRLADAYIERAAIVELIEACDEVHTLTSLAGFEALLRGKPVHCYGVPFYAGWGLTVDHARLARRGRRLRLEELVAAALILYPRYFDPVAGRPCGPEAVIARIEQRQAEPGSGPLLVRLRQLLGRTRRRLGIPVRR